jgi:hypothetical protein
MLQVSEAKHFGSLAQVFPGAEILRPAGSE